MKKLIALTALLSMSVAFADEDVVYGTFVLNSSEPELILCVPWVNPGSTDGSIPVTDLIQTSTLEVDDQLFYYDKGDKVYKAWQVSASKAWEEATTVSGLKVVSPTGTETLTRGNAIILKRDMETNKNRSKDIIINGQVGGTFNGINLTRAEGMVYSLIAPPNPDGATLLSAGTWTGLNNDDCVIIGMKPYYYNGSVWGERKGALEKDSSGKIVRGWVEANPAPSIPAGQGAWLVTQGGDGNVKWNL